MNLQELIELNNTSKYAISARYKKNAFQENVDSLIGHLYEYYGGKFFYTIIKDIEIQRKSYFEYTNRDFFDLYMENPKKFSAKFTSSSRGKSKMASEFYDAIFKKYGSLLEESGNALGSVLYDDIYPDHKNNKCKSCDNSVMFITKRYSLYCSAKCCQSDYDRVPKESQIIAKEKRMAKMKILLADPVKGAEYRAKISTNSASRTPEARLKSSIRMKRMIADGTLTPNITNTWNHWDASVLGKKFRSRFEAIFFAYCHEFDIPVQYEKLRIPYTHNNNTRTYVVDFVNHRDKIVYEIKPISMVSDEVVVIKEIAANKWCVENGYDFVFVTEIDLKEYAKRMTASRVLVEDYLKVYKW